MSITDTVKDNVFIFLSGIAITAFGTGWAACKSVNESQGQELILKTRRAELEHQEAALSTCRSSLDKAAAKPTEPNMTVCPDRSSFVAGEWHYEAIKDTGKVVASRLNELRPKPGDIVVRYDGSANDTFHVWYRGGGSKVKYQYSSAGTEDLKELPEWNYFLPSAEIVPAGIGTGGGRPVPIYFRASN